LPLSLVDYFEPSSVTLICCTDPAISRHRSASCVVIYGYIDSAKSLLLRSPPSHSNYTNLSAFM
jgi:hypothetical protein